MGQLDIKPDSTKLMTIKDVAKLADVSIGTVSRVINDSGYVSLETRRKVEKVLNKTGFMPNMAARSMIRKKSLIIGVIIPEINNPFLSGLVVSIEDMISRENYSILLCNSKYKLDKEENFVDNLIQRNAEGLVFIASELRSDKLMKKAKKHLNVVLISSKFGGFDCVNLTDSQAAFEMTQHLISLGHHRIACIGFNEVSNTTMERLRGYTEALAKNNIEVKNEFMLAAQTGMNVGYERTKQLMQLEKPPTAIFAVNDYYAINSYFAIKEKGLMVGKDISVAGFDDIPIASLLSPSLTTVKFPTETMAELAVDMLMKRINRTSSDEMKDIIIPAHVVKRDSTQICSEI